jgi:hypothetical protein
MEMTGGSDLALLSGGTDFPPLRLQFASGKK